MTTNLLMHSLGKQLFIFHLVLKFKKGSFVSVQKCLELRWRRKFISFVQSYASLMPLGDSNLPGKRFFEQIPHSGMSYPLSLPRERQQMLKFHQFDKYSQRKIRLQCYVHLSGFSPSLRILTFLPVLTVRYLNDIQLESAF